MFLINTYDWYINLIVRRKIMKSIIKRVLGGDWTSLQQDIEKMAADKVKSKVDEKKFDVLAKLNGINVEKQKEMLALAGK